MNPIKLLFDEIAERKGRFKAISKTLSISAINQVVSGGKTYLACAVGRHACVQRYSVRYYRLSRLFEGLRHLALKNTLLAKASPQRIRLVLLKIGAAILRNTRRIRFLMSSVCPHQALYRQIALTLNTS